jgi:tetratricopeptide (TPR) repeat protein
MASEDLSELVICSTSFDVIPLSRMVELAEFGEVEKTEHWYTGLARVMMQAGYYAAAIENFRRALDISPYQWVAMEGRARCLRSVWRREEAIEWMEKCVQAVPANLWQVVAELREDIGEWKLELGNLDDTIEAAERELKRDYFNFLSYETYLRLWALRRGRRPGEIIELLKDLDRHESGNSTRSLLVQMISYGYDIYESIGLAAVTIGGSEGATVLEIMRNAIDDGIIAADKNTDNLWPSVNVRIFAGKFSYRYLNNVDLATAFWESGLQLIADHFGDTLKYDCSIERGTCSTHLAEVFFQKAVEAKDEGGDYESWIAKLQRLSTFADSLRSETELRKTFGTGYPTRLYGIWLREHGNADDSRWRECLRPYILHSIEFLTDDDLSNDQWGYSTLGRTLLHAGDLENGLAALAVTLKAMEASQAQHACSLEVRSGEAVIKFTEAVDPPGVSDPSPSRQLIPPTKPLVEEPSSASETPQTDRGPQPVLSKLPRVKLSSFSDAFWICDGPCTTPHHTYRELHFCIICNDTCFCEKCILLVKGSRSSSGDDQSEPKRLPYRKCSPDHTFVQAYPIRELGNKNLAATIRDGYVELNTEWLMSLKAQWTSTE